jgi:hypothetical protein
MTIPSSYLNKNLNTIPPINRVHHLAKPRSTTNATKQSNQNKNDRKNATTTRLDTKSVALGVVSFVALGATIVSCVLWSKNKKLQSQAVPSSPKLPNILETAEYKALEAKNATLEKTLNKNNEYATEMRKIHEIINPNATHAALESTTTIVNNLKDYITLGFPRALMLWMRLLKDFNPQDGDWNIFPLMKNSYLTFEKEMTKIQALHQQKYPDTANLIALLPEKGYARMPFDIPPSEGYTSIHSGSRASSSYIGHEGLRQYNNRLLDAYELVEKDLFSDKEFYREPVEYTTVDWKRLAEGKNLLALTTEQVSGIFMSISNLSRQCCLGSDIHHGWHMQMQEEFLSRYLKKEGYDGVYLHDPEIKQGMFNSRLYLFDKPDLSQYEFKE